MRAKLMEIIAWLFPSLCQLQCESCGMVIDISRAEEHDKFFHPEKSA